jgi:hypothetical protein
MCFPRSEQVEPTKGPPVLSLSSTPALLAGGAFSSLFKTLSLGGEGFEGGRDIGENVNNAQYKSNRNWHYKSPPLYNEYILIEIHLKNLYFYCYK